jgi:hypothetical protein
MSPEEVGALKSHFRAGKKAHFAKSENFQSSSNEERLVSALHAVAKDHNFHCPERSYFECDNFSRAAHRAAQELGVKSEVWHSKLTYDHDIGEISAGEGHGHSFLKIGHKFYDHTASQATSKMPAPYVGDQPHSLHDQARKHGDQDYYDSDGSDYWHQKIKEKMSSEFKKSQSLGHARQSPTSRVGEQAISTPEEESDEVNSRKLSESLEKASRVDI